MFRIILISFFLNIFFVSIVIANENSIRKRIIKTAKEQIGDYYEMDSISGGWPPGLDCSGLVGYSYKKANFKGFQTVTEKSHGPNTTRLVEMSEKINKNELLIGDLVFVNGTWDKNYDGVVNSKDIFSHVGIYIGNGKYIHQKGPVVINSFNESDSDFNPSRFSSFKRAQRILTSINKNGVQLVKNCEFYK